MPVWEIVIKGKFITGTTIDDEELAKKKCEEMLLERLEIGGVSDSKGHGLFQWVKESVEAERL
ncbi:hypothetical protein ES703_62228 [subsurface metagenome]